MDHHCPWVDNCIGFYNKKFFMQLIFYFFLTSFLFCITYFPYSYDIIKMLIDTDGRGNTNIIYKNFVILLNNLILLGFSIIDFNFLKFHIKLISSNLTTIETLDNDLIQNKKYDLGFIENFKQVFGECKLLWFLPINLPIGYPNGDGLTWPTRDDMINLDNLNINNDNNIENDKNTFDDDTIEKNVKKNSFIGKNGIPQTRASSMKDYHIGNKSTYKNYSKYNTVKRNSGNYSSNSTRYDSNSNSGKRGYIKNDDILSK